MKPYTLEETATEQNFDEAAYLLTNPDVADAVNAGVLVSGRKHFESFGKKEGRRLRRVSSLFAAAKSEKLARVKPLLREDMPYDEKPGYYDFLSDSLRKQFNIIDTDAVSSNGYDAHMLALIEKYENGLILDCGAGKRPVYYDNVVNFEIADHDTTDVRGVGEQLPFIDGAFDAVMSIAVLEHVKDPFLCAREITRVIKPGGSLICGVAFLQPFHGYPHHYYNMTCQGVENLFANLFEIEKVDVYGSLLPISSLTWILRSWAEGLNGKTKEDFLQMRVCELVNPETDYWDRPFVKELSKEKNMELASGTIFFGHKKMNRP